MRRPPCCATLFSLQGGGAPHRGLWLLLHAPAGMATDALRSAVLCSVQGGQELLTAEARLTEPFGSFDKLPKRRDDYDFSQVSIVRSTPLRCVDCSEKHGGWGGGFEALQVEGGL